jgi:hypothetical protein
MGIRGDEIKKQLTLAPHLPARWDSVDLKRFRIGDQSFSISIRKTARTIKATIEKNSDEAYAVVFSPELAPFTKIQSATIDGSPASFTVEESSQDMHARVSARVTRKLEIELQFAFGIEIDVPVEDVTPGDRTSGLKFLGIERGSEHLKLTVEGAVGRMYKISVRSALADLKVDGGTLDTGSGAWKDVAFSIPGDQLGGYAKKTLTISFSRRAAGPKRQETLKQGPATNNKVAR